MQIVGMDLLQLVISIINFAVMFALFRQVVILPMQDAVKVRAARVQTRLDEIEKVVAEARETEARYKAQFEKLAQEKHEIKEAADREVTRVRDRIIKEAEAEAAHLVDKAKIEAEKMHASAMADLQSELARKAGEQARQMLANALDPKAQADLAETFVGKVGQLRAS